MKMAKIDAFTQFLQRYRNNPVLFAREVLGVEPDPWQVEMMNAVATGERRLSIRSGHGI